MRHLQVLQRREGFRLHRDGSASDCTEQSFAHPQAPLTAWENYGTAFLARRGWCLVTRHVCETLLHCRKAAGMSSAIATSVVSLAVLGCAWLLLQVGELLVQALMKDLRVPVVQQATRLLESLRSRPGRAAAAGRSGPMCSDGLNCGASFAALGPFGSFIFSCTEPIQVQFDIMTDERSGKLMVSLPVHSHLVAQTARAHMQTSNSGTLSWFM